MPRTWEKSGLRVLSAHLIKHVYMPKYRSLEELDAWTPSHRHGPCRHMGSAKLTSASAYFRNASDSCSAKKHAKMQDSASCKIRQDAMDCLQTCCDIVKKFVDNETPLFSWNLSDTEQQAADSLLHAVILHESIQLESRGKGGDSAEKLDLTHTKDQISCMISTAASGRKAFFLHLARDLAQAAGAGSSNRAGKSTSATSSVIFELLENAMVLSYQIARLQCANIVLGLAAAVDFVLVKANTGSKTSQPESGIPPGLAFVKPQHAEFFVHLIAAAITTTGDANLAGTLLKVLGGLADRSHKPAMRKALLDLAEAALPMPLTPFSFNVAEILAEGCHDMDATVRSKALSSITSGIDFLWQIDLMFPVFDAIIIPEVASRMLDVAKTVRNKALVLAADILAYIPHAKEPRQFRNSPEVALQRAATLQTQRAAILSWLPPLCQIIGARRDSQLHDEGSLQVARDVLLLASSLLSPAVYVSAVLEATDWSERDSSTGTQTDVFTSGMSMDSSLVSTLLKHVKLQETDSFEATNPQMAALYKTWADYLHKQYAIDKVDRLSNIVLETEMIGPVRKLAFHDLCSIMSKASALDSGTDEAWPQLTDHVHNSLLRCIKVIYCFTASTELPRLDKNQHPPLEQADSVEELAVLLDALNLMLGPQADTSLFESTSCLAPLSSLQHQVVFWVLNILTKVVLLSKKDLSSGEAGLKSATAKPRVMITLRLKGEPKSTCAASNRVLSMVLKYLLKHLRLLVCHMPVGVTSVALNLFTSCPGSGPHMRMLLKDLEQELAQLSIMDPGETELSQYKTGVASAMTPPERSQMVSAGITDTSSQHMRDSPSETSPKAAIDQPLQDAGAEVPGTNILDHRVPSRLAAAFLLVLQNMAYAYEQERDTLSARLAQEAGNSNQDGGKTPTEVAGKDLACQSSPHLAAGDAVDGETAPNYMQHEEDHLLWKASVQEFMSELMQVGTAPASRIPLMQSLLCQQPAEAGFKRQTGARAALQVLALRALVRLMLLSDDLTMQHNKLLCDILQSASASLDEQTAESHQSGGENILLLQECITATESLVQQNPNINSALFLSLERLTSSALKALDCHLESEPTTNGDSPLPAPKRTTPASELVTGFTEAALTGSLLTSASGLKNDAVDINTDTTTSTSMPVPGGKEAGPSTVIEADSGRPEPQYGDLDSAAQAAPKDMAPNQDTDLADMEGIQQMQGDKEKIEKIAPLKRLFLLSLSSYARVLVAGACRHSSSTYTLLARLLLSSTTQAVDIAIPLVQSILQAASKQQRTRVLLSIFSHCEADLRLNLVESILLPHRLLRSTDLSSDDLVLPLIHSLAVSGPDSRAALAAAGLLGRMTPSARALPPLLAYLQAHGAESSVSMEILKPLRTFVLSYQKMGKLHTQPDPDHSGKPPSHVEGTHASDQGLVDITNTGEPGQKTDAQGVLPKAVTDTTAASKSMHTKLLTLLDDHIACQQNGKHSKRKRILAQKQGNGQVRFSLAEDVNAYHRRLSSFANRKSNIAGVKGPQPRVRVVSPVAQASRVPSAPSF
eukprot:gene14523-20555_t